jgi:hypothetical protein
VQQELAQVLLEPLEQVQVQLVRQVQELVLQVQGQVLQE